MWLGSKSATSTFTSSSAMRRAGLAAINSGPCQRAVTDSVVATRESGFVPQLVHELHRRSGRAGGPGRKEGHAVADAGHAARLERPSRQLGQDLSGGEAAHDGQFLGGLEDVGIEVESGAHA